jgi:ATP-dependent Clp protease ATP-binding subunit ClpC
MYWCNNIETNTDNIEKDIRKTFSKDNCGTNISIETITILNNIKKIRRPSQCYLYTTIEACVKLTDRYMSERFLPDKALMP